MRQYHVHDEFESGTNGDLFHLRADRVVHLAQNLIDPRAGDEVRPAVVTALVTPGCTIFAPPAQPAYMCGMMLPTAMLISLSRYWRLTWMGCRAG